MNDYTKFHTLTVFRRQCQLVMGFSGQKSKIDSTLPMWLRKMGEMGVNGVKLGEDNMSSYFTLVQPNQHMPRNASQRTSLLIGVLYTEGPDSKSPLINGGYQAPKGSSPLSV